MAKSGFPPTHLDGRAQKAWHEQKRRRYQILRERAAAFKSPFTTEAEVQQFLNKQTTNSKDSRHENTPALGTSAPAGIKLGY